MKVGVLLAASLAASLLVLPTVSEARVPADGERVSASVRSADLDLSSASGQAALQRRVASSIRRICADPGAVDLAGRTAVRNCINEARQETGDGARLAAAAARSRPARA